MKLVKNFIVMLSLLVSISSFAADPAPLAMLKGVSDNMLVELKQHVGQLKTDKKIVYDLVNRILVPHFDLVSMSRAVVGRDYWQNATEKAQQQFIKEFTHYIISTYASALRSYDGEIIKFYPIRDDVGGKVRVSSDIVLKNGPAIQIQYGLQKQGNEWLIYDFSVDGISIVKNYNSQYAGILRQSGLGGLVKELQKRNIGK